MKSLIITLLVTSSVDSLNPIGITQQFILQGGVKKPRHIWYFILTTAVVNILFGYLVYYGVVKVVSALLADLLAKHASTVFMFEILFGIVLLLFIVWWLIKRNVVKKKNRRTGGGSGLLTRNALKTKFKHITPLTLIYIGVLSTVSELTSAAPYFVFLSVLGTYQLSFGMLTLVFMLYNIIYIAPFVLLYVSYLLSKKSFDKLYAFFRKNCGALLGNLVPLLFLLVAGFMIINGFTNMVGA
ncbi:MAG: GAP family protein [Alphaproteobacteria bacterium]|nr:GAP family protein [Alphaproteobacteria bacterium]